MYAVLHRENEHGRWRFCHDDPFDEEEEAQLLLYGETMIDNRQFKIVELKDVVEN